MEMKRGELRQFINSIEATLRSDAELSFDIIYAITKTKNKTKSFMEEIVDMVTSTQKIERQLMLKYCDRDKEDKPVITGERYAGLEPGRKPEYDVKIEELIDKRNNYLKETIDIPIHHIKKENIPKKEKAFIMETLCYFINDDE